MQATDWFSIDLAAFYNVYDHLRTIELGTLQFIESPPPPHIFIPTTMDNKMDGESYGLEIAANLQPADWWNLQAACTFLQMHFHLDGDSTDLLLEQLEDDIHYQINLRSEMNLTDTIELDCQIRSVGRKSSIPSYSAVDARLGWHPTKSFELSVGAQNLLDDRHKESANPISVGYVAAEVERNVYVKAVWRF